MKKQLLNLSVAFATTMFFAGGLLAQHQAPVRSADVPALKVANEIVIDGVADETSWGTAMDTWEKFNSTGVTGDADFSGSLKLCWDWDYLYIFVNVTDDVETSWATGVTGAVHEYDCIEYFQDQDTSITNGTGAYLGDEIQGRISRGNDTLTGTAPRNGGTVEFKIVNNSADYQIEAKLPWLGFFPAETTETLHDWFDKALGFDCQIADNDGAGRDGQFMWDADVEGSGAEEDNAWKDTRTFGVIKLTGTPASAIKPVSNSNFEVYPNPASSQVNFNNLEGVTSIEIVNITGQMVKVVDVNATNVNLNVSDLSSGTYFARIYTNNGVATERIQIK